METFEFIEIKTNLVNCQPLANIDNQYMVLFDDFELRTKDKDSCLQFVKDIHTFFGLHVDLNNVIRFSFRNTINGKKHMFERCPNIINNIFMLNINPYTLLTKNALIEII